jgi:hypothetical protein
MGFVETNAVRVISIYLFIFKMFFFLFDQWPMKEEKFLSLKDAENLLSNFADIFNFK